jgi:uncharacterized membrane protein
MSDASVPPPVPPSDRAPDVEAGHPAEVVPTANPAPASGHHGLIAFLGVLALILLLVGAVGSAWSTGGSGSDVDQQAVAPGQGHAYGQQKQAERAARRAERDAEKAARRAQREAEKRARQEQRRQSGAMGPETVEALSTQTGTLATQVDADGTTVYVLQTATGTLILDVGPPQYWGENHPLKPLVGQTVTITGVQETGSDQFEVFTVNGEMLRGPGRPPWAGGWKADGQMAPTASPSPGSSPTTSPTP